MWDNLYSNETQVALNEDKFFSNLSSSINCSLLTTANTQSTSARSSSNDDSNHGSKRVGSAKLPDMGNIDSEQLSEFRDSYMKSNIKASLLRKEDFTLNELNIKEFKFNPIGRDDEVQQLKDAFKVAASGQGPSVATIIGASGTGKSVLAQQLRVLQTVEAASGFFCSGQFFDSNEPFTGFTQAMSDLTQQILSKNENFVQKFAKSLEESVADDIPILLHFIPSLKKLGLKAVTYATEYGKEDNNGNITNRSHQINIAMKKFIKTLCGNEIPLVLVLDDIQWADPSSIRLMTSLVNDENNSFFCLITTSHPDKNKEKTHVLPFFEKLEDVKNDITVEKIELNDLIYLEAHSVVCTALRSEDNPKINPLSKIVFDKTHGNPFFMLTFLQSLVDDNLLEYNLGILSFTWDLDAIMAKSATDNVADLAVASLSKLDSALQSVLKVASCLGQAFTKDEVNFVVKGLKQDSSSEFEDTMQEAKHINEALEKLLNRGVLVSHWLPDTYSFVHGQTQLAAFNLIPEEQQSQFRLAVGQRLIDGMDSYAKMTKYLCLAIDLCNSGLDLLEETKVIRFARWNLLAGEFTMQKGAFLSALKYFDVGIDCLGHNFWEHHSKLSLALHSGAAEASWSLGELEKNEKYCNAVIERKDQFTVQERTRVYLSRISALGDSKRFSEGIDVGRNILKELRMANLPRRPGLLIVLKEIMKTNRLTKDVTRESLLALPDCTDQDRACAMGVITRLATAAFNACTNFWTIMFLKAMRWTVKYGITDYSAVTISMYALIVNAVSKDAKRAYEFGEAAMELARARNLRSQKVRIISVFYGYIQYLTQPIRHSLLPLAYGYKLGIETGEIDNGVMNIFLHDNNMFMTGAKPLPELVVDLAAHVKVMVEYKQDVYIGFELLVHQFALNLIGEPANQDPMKLTGSAMNEDEFLNKAIKEKQENLVGYVNDFRCHLAFIFGDMEGAWKIASAILKDSHMLQKFDFEGIWLVCTVGLIASALAGSSRKIWNRRKYLKTAVTMKKQLETWIKAGNVNILQMLKIVEAEIAAVTDVGSSATEELYKESVAAATRSGMVNFRAMAHEKAAQYYMKVNKDDNYWASYHMKNAVECYRDWGAMKVVEYLQLQHGALLGEDEGEADVVNA